ncbi:hypothetical protein D9M68_959950 [compost metagenome]
MNRPWPRLGEQRLEQRQRVLHEEDGHQLRGRRVVGGKHQQGHGHGGADNAERESLPIGHGRCTELECQHDERDGSGPGEEVRRHQVHVRFDAQTDGAAQQQRGDGAAHHKNLQQCHEDVG